MRLSTSRVLSFDSKSGLSTVAWPTSASTAVPPRAGFGTVATGWHPMRARAAANAAAARLLGRMRRHPDVGDRADQEAGHEYPRRPVDLPLQAASSPVAAAESIAATADRASEPRRLGRLSQHTEHEEQRKHGLSDDERISDLIHGSGDSTCGARD